ncbi:programmed cell death 6-interacting protein-like [Pollicipes pollicipes]|uniref:programmed cell death 6-interacting protein-like n=1 Tax=Pollicipes pollicipes TaxID=41117 RepID=UPI00188565D1|nr:programmed cell death 6-interacting protein-like [Pollicipes pollicipes]XP_037071952.1 programmed cell death 6-interacting protein-like [Pollicipes pollicipes]XP_037071953.1 programmed cell death 6-interacting protein-like [Pollicipes pollicipes]XP_037071954.1 programmed cell death 6-interacting protein-like [Pollicipes pollicipes]
MEFIAVPIKRTSEQDLVRPLKSIIASSYSTADNPADYADAIQDMNKLRASATWKSFDKTESSLEVLYRYYDQLVATEAKIPAQEVTIYFKWKDAFDKGSWLSGRQSLTIASFAFERVCILFNIAALQSQIAAVQNFESDDGLKMAAKMLQHSASNFHYLKTTVMSAIHQEPTPDLNPETLAALSQLMQAQAQEAFALKAIRDQMKEAIIAKVCAQCDDYFGEALKAMQRESVKSLWEREWLTTVSLKQSLYQGLAEYYQSRICNADKKVGEEISRLQRAESLLRSAASRGGDVEAWGVYAVRAQQALTSAKKDNDFIYHERVPDPKALPPIGKAAIAKILSQPEHYSRDFRDLFAQLTPVHVQQAMATYEVRKAELVNMEVGRLREATQTLNGVLASLNLPAALEDTSGTALPASIREKAATVRGDGGLQAIQAQLDDLPELLTRNKEILEETQRMLDEEAASDDQLRGQFAAKWTRTPSAKLTESFQQNGAKYRQILANAVQADAVVRAKFDANRAGIELLSRPEAELVAATPRGEAGVDGGSPAAQRLRALMERVDAIKSDRDALECQLKSATTDLKAKFLEGLQADGAVSESAISEETLATTYGPLRTAAAESLRKQEELLAEVQEANTEFVAQRGSGGSSRDTLFKDLATAHDVFTELRGNLKEGLKFYNDLTQLLLTFQNKVSDFCFARKTEKEELMKDMTSTLANQTAGTTPTPPQSQAAAGGVRQPPPRPPPPATTAAASSAPPATSGDATPNPYAGAPPGALPYPIQPQAAMPQPYAPFPFYTPMPGGFNPYGTYPGAMPQQHGYGYPYPQQQQQQQQQQYPQQGQQPYPGYPYPRQQYR